MADKNKITVELRLRDLATKELKTFERNTKRTGREGKKAFDKVDKAAKKTRISIKKLAAVAAAGFAVFKGFQAANSLAIGFSQAAASAEEAEGKFRAVFKELAEGTETTLGAFAAEVGRSNFELKRFASSFQDIFVPLGLARDKAADLSIVLTALAVDVGAFSDRADADVVNDFTSALVGSTETVRKYGIVLLETRVKAEALRLGLVAQGEELDELTKLAARASLIFQGTADAQGSALREFDSFTSTIKRLNAAIDILRIKAGEYVNKELLALIDRYGGLDAVSKRVGQGFKFISAAFVSTTRVLAALADTFLKFIDELGGGDQFVVLITQAGVQIEFFFKKLSARFPQFVAQFRSFAQNIKLEVASLAETIETISNELTGKDSTAARDRRIALTAGAVFLSELAKLKEQAADKAVAALNKERDAALEAAAAIASIGAGGGADAGDENSFEAFIGALLSEEGGLQAFFDLWINGLVKGAQKTDEQTESLTAAELAFRRFRGTVENLSGPLGNAALFAGEFVEIISDEVKFEVASKAARRLRKQQYEYKQSLEETEPVLRQAFDLVEKFASKIRDVVVLEFEATSATAGAKQAFEDFGASLSDFNLGRNATSAFFQTVTQGLFDVTGALLRGEKSFSDFARSVALSIGEIIAQFYLLRAIRDGLGFSAGGLFSGFGFGDSITGLANGGVMQGQMSNSLPINGYANGGIANSPQMAIFGEGRGAEAFVPLPDGKNIPVKMEGGGGGVTVNITVPSLDPKTAAEVIQANLPTITSGVANAILSGQDRKLVQAVGRG